MRYEDLKFLFIIQCFVLVCTVYDTECHLDTHVWFQYQINTLTYTILNKY